jgi:16S rRNA (cytidine1402-2'-O)-methyltransferase
VTIEADNETRTAGALPDDLAPPSSNHAGIRTNLSQVVKDACVQVIAAAPGAASRRELYDAVLRSRG